jgi:siroheme synthase
VRAARAADTVAIYMGAGEAAAIAAALLEAGKPASTPAIVVENASLEAAIAAGTLAQLPELAARCGDGPAVVMVGEALREVAAAQAAAPRRARNASHSA